MATSCTAEPDNNAASHLATITRQVAQAIAAARQSKPARIRLVFRDGLTAHIAPMHLLTKSSIPFADIRALEAFRSDPRIAVVVIDDEFDPDYFLNQIGNHLSCVEPV